MDDKRNSKSHLLIFYKNKMIKKLKGFVLFLLLGLISAKIGFIIFNNNSDTIIYLENEINIPGAIKNIQLFVNGTEIYDDFFYPDSLQFKRLTQLLWFGNHSIICVVDGVSMEYQFKVFFSSYITLGVNDSIVSFESSHIKSLKM